MQDTLFYRNLLLVANTFFSIVHGSRMHSEQNFYSS